MNRKSDLRKIFKQGLALLSPEGGMKLNTCDTRLGTFNIPLDINKSCSNHLFAAQYMVHDHRRITEMWEPSSAAPDTSILKDIQLLARGATVQREAIKRNIN